MNFKIHIPERLIFLLNSPAWPPPWMELASYQHDLIILLWIWDELRLLCLCHFRRRCSHLSGQLCPKIFPPRRRTPPKLHQSRDPGSILPCVLALVHGTLNKHFSGLCYPCGGGHPNKKTSGEIPLRDFHAYAFKAICREHEGQIDCSATQLSPIPQDTVEKSSHLFGTWLFNCQNERIWCNKRYGCSCSSILQWLPLHGGTAFLSQVKNQSLFWCLG